MNIKSKDTNLEFQPRQIAVNIQNVTTESSHLSPTERDTPLS